MIRAGIIGASGYTGGELARLLSNHPDIVLTLATSRQNKGKLLSDVFPNLKGISDIQCTDGDIQNFLGEADFFFTAVPHKTAMTIIPGLLKGGKKVVDLSADFRLKDPETYEHWYQQHTAKDYLKEAAYGLPELYRETISNARLVANPGCYPTSVILALAPLLRAGVLDTDTLIIDSKSGASGAGRTALQSSLYCEVNEGFRAYKIGEHRHTPEIEQEISLLAQKQITLSFTPHLLPMSRGILSTIYANITTSLSQDEAYELFRTFYEEDFFVRIFAPDSFPATQFVCGSNFCDLGLKIDSRTNRIIILSAIDNLVKGAAGQAIQNMNLMCGFHETKGLAAAPLFP